MEITNVNSNGNYKTIIQMEITATGIGLKKDN
jgi:hypothetical protein